MFIKWCAPPTRSYPIKEKICEDIDGYCMLINQLLIYQDISRNIKVLCKCCGQFARQGDLPQSSPQHARQLRDEVEFSNAKE